MSIEYLLVFHLSFQIFVLFCLIFAVTILTIVPDALPKHLSFCVPEGEDGLVFSFTDTSLNRFYKII